MVSVDAAADCLAEFDIKHSGGHFPLSGLFTEMLVCPELRLADIECDCAIIWSQRCPFNLSKGQSSDCILAAIKKG
jgi:hypothetical protein